MAQTVKNPPAMQETWVRSLGWEDPSCGSAGEESACNARDLGSIPGLVRSPGEGKDYLLQCSGLENSMERRVWRARVHSIALRQLLDFAVSSAGKEFTCNEGDPGKIHWRRDSLPTPVFLGFPGGSAGK